MPLVREAVEGVLRKIAGILDVAWLSVEDRRHVALREGADSGNIGLNEVLSRQHVCTVLSSAQFRHERSSCVQWVVDGVVIGEEVSDAERRAELLTSPEVGQMGKNFLLYYDRMKGVRGKKPRFVYRPLPFDEVAACKNVREVVSASPGADVDLYLKQRFGWSSEDRRLGTIVVGFNRRDKGAAVQ